MTPNQVGAFQSTGRDWAGKPLSLDQDLGPRTKWALAIADLPRYRRRIVELACARVGVREAPPGSNTGPEIDIWLTDAGAHPGDLFGWVNADGTGHVGFAIGFTAEGIATCEGNSDDGVRVCSRPVEGLDFRRVVSPQWHCELCSVAGAPVVRRAVEGTR